MVLAKLPGTNPAYQPGDECPAGHFSHTFQGAAEIRGELVGAGVIARELSWNPSAQRKPYVSRVFGEDILTAHVCSSDR